jgi:outer membrane protein assembly factor BamB
VSRTPAAFLAAAVLLGLPAADAQQSKPKPKGKEGLADWGQFRGPQRDGISTDTGLLPQWPAGGPPLLWKVNGLGQGYSSVSVTAKQIFTMGDVDGGCHLIALSLADGKVQWKLRVGDSSSPGGYAGPRCTPASDGTLVYAIGQNGDLVCAQAATGKTVWKKHMERDFGGRVMSGWGWSESPLIDGTTLVVTPGGGRGTVAALNRMSGQPLWQSGELKDAAAYTSLLPIETGRIRQYVVFTDKTVAGVLSTTGKLLWQVPRPGQTAICSTPVYADGFLFVSSGYNVGCNGYSLQMAGNAFRVQQLYEGKQMRNHHGGMILSGGHVYGTDEGVLKCIDVKTGNVAWEDRSVGKGSVILADGNLIVRAEGGSGAVALVEATPTGYKEKGRFNQPDRSDKNSWANPVVFGGRLYLRDDDVLLCYNLKAD